MWGGWLNEKIYSGVKNVLKVLSLQFNKYLKICLKFGSNLLSYQIGQCLTTALLIFYGQLFTRKSAFTLGYKFPAKILRFRK